MFKISARTEGIQGLGAELLKETERDVLSPIARAGEKLVARARQKLDVRGGPSRAGDPPAKDTGTLQDTVGRTGPYVEAGAAQLSWGIGVGDKARARLRKHAARLGVDEASLFKKANLHEHGGFGAEGQRYPARPFIRPTESELEAEIMADIARAL